MQGKEAAGEAHGRLGELEWARADHTKASNYKCCRFGRSPRGPYQLIS